MKEYVLKVIEEFFKNNPKYFLEGLTSTISDMGGFLNGGAILSILTGKEIQDLDFYIPEVNYHRMVAGLLQGEGLVSDSFNMIVNYTNRAATFYNSEEGLVFQVIPYKSESGTYSWEDSVASFDFTVCQIGISFDSRGVPESVFYGDDWEKHFLSRELVFNPTTSYPFASLLRVEKYKDKGYTMRHKESIKLAVAINQLGVLDDDAVAEQLGGFYGANIVELSSEEGLTIYEKLDKGREREQGSTPPKLKHLITAPQAIATAVYRMLGLCSGSGDVSELKMFSLEYDVEDYLEKIFYSEGGEEVFKWDSEIARWPEEMAKAREEAGVVCV